MSQAARSYLVHSLTCGCGFVSSGSSWLGADRGMLDHFARFIAEDKIDCRGDMPAQGLKSVTVPAGRSKYIVPAALIVLP
jgi:hypothetical protein